MYIPCQIMDLSSLDSHAHASMMYLRRLCCPCSTRCRSTTPRRPSNQSKHQQSVMTEDPEMVFSRHRAAVIASHRFLSNHAGIWNLQNLAPPLPQLAPPPLPPRRLSSFFPPMPPMSPRRHSASGENRGDRESEQQRATPGHRERKITTPSAPTPAPRAAKGGSGENLDDRDSPLPAKPKRPSTSIACPYLSPPDMAATSWEWDLGNSETLRTHGWTPSRSDPERSAESGASNRVNVWGDPPVVKKGLLMQQRERMWSRWKERYFILTRDYLHCFRRLRNVYRLQVTLSAMGQFIYKLRLANVEEIRWESRRSGSRIALVVTHEATILLRSSDDNMEALHHWYQLLQECVCMSKIRRQALRSFNSSSEENSSSPGTHVSGPYATADAYLRTSNNLDSNTDSSYTVATSATSGSSQTDIVEIYKRCGSTSIKPQQRRCATSIGIRPVSNSRCSLYPPPPVRPLTQQMKRLPLPLPALDSESEIDDLEIQDILEGLPERCTNPTREIEALSSSSFTSEVKKRDFISTITKSSASPSHPDECHIPPSRCESRITLTDFVEVRKRELVSSVTKSSASPSPPEFHIPPSRCESRVTLRDFVKTPWRSSSACLMPQQPPASPTPSQLLIRNLRESQLENSSRLSAFPVPSRRPAVPQRPMSSFSRPPPHVFGGRKVLPTPWMKNPTLQIGKGAAFSRSNVIVCPSKLSADVTYLRRM